MTLEATHINGVEDLMSVSGIVGLALVVMLVYFGKQVLIALVLIYLAFTAFQHNTDSSSKSETPPPPTTTHEETDFSAEQYFKDCLELTQKSDLCAEIAAQIKGE